MGVGDCYVVSGVHCENGWWNLANDGQHSFHDFVRAAAHAVVQEQEGDGGAQVGGGVGE